MTRLLAAAIVALFGVSSASADFTWAEVGDAGNTLLTANDIVGPTGDNLTNITGTIASGSDFDLFRFSITNPTLFSASTVGTVGSLTDTQLFLFNANGFGVAANDDSVGFRSTLPVGNALYATLQPGDYFIAISGFDVDPVSIAGEIFPDTPFSAVHGPTGPGGAFPISGSAGSSGTGTYNIALTAASTASTPAPAAVWMGLAGMGVVGMLRRRFK